jgi:hypothetical protein
VAYHVQAANRPTRGATTMALRLTTARPKAEAHVEGVAEQAVVRAPRTEGYPPHAGF